MSVIMESAAAAAFPPPERWTCLTCASVNPANTHKCRLCQTERFQMGRPNRYARDIARRRMHLEQYTKQNSNRRRSSRVGVGAGSGDPESDRFSLISGPSVAHIDVRFRLYPTPEIDLS